MKIGYASDIHIEHGVRPHIVPSEHVDVLILAGDIGKGVSAIEYAHNAFSELATHIIMVAGNHEFWGGTHSKVITAMREYAKQYPHIHFLENDTVEIDGIFFIGCTAWTNHSYGGNTPLNRYAADEKWSDYAEIKWTDYGKHYRSMTTNDTVRMNADAHLYIFNQLHKLGRENCVVITHMAPTERSISEKYIENNWNHCYVNTWGNNIAYHGPRLWFHGHVHDSFDYMVGSTRVICNPIGYHMVNDKGEVTMDESGDNNVKVMELPDFVDQKFDID